MRTSPVAAGVSLLLLAGCGPSPATPVAVTSKSPAAATPSIAAQSPMPSLAPTPTPPVATNFEISCRLPITFPNPDGTQTERGWVAFPGGRLTVEERGTDHDLYDWAIGRWTSGGILSADGLTEVTPLQLDLPQPGPLYLVDLKTGTRRTLLTTTEQANYDVWGVIGYSGDAVYLNDWRATGDNPPHNIPGLWRLDVRSGAITNVESLHYWTLPGAGAVWAADSDPFAVYRYDLATGQIVSWYHDGIPVGLMSQTPHGGMLAGYEDDSGRGFLVELKGNNEIASVPWPSDFPIWFSGAGDQWGVWLMLMGQIALYREGLGVHMMATIGVSGVATVAGDCR